MGKIRLTSLLVLMTLLTACGPQLIPIDDDSVILYPSVEIVYPLDQDTLGPYHAAVVASAYLPNGIGGMEFSIDGNPPTLYEFPANQVGNSYIETHAYWFPADMGSTILSVVVYNMDGQPAASDQIEVFVEIESVDTDPIETLIAQTLTALAQDQIQGPIPTDTPTPIPVNKFSPCEMFEQTETTLTLHDIQPGSNKLTFFLTFGFEVPGLENRAADDDQLYLYSAQLGGGEPVECSYQGYTRRLYCTKTLPESELDTVQPLTVTLNLCELPIYSHMHVSLIAPVCTRESGESDCEALGGVHSCVRDNCACACP